MSLVPWVLLGALLAPAIGAEAPEEQEGRLGSAPRWHGALELHLDLPRGGGLEVDNQSRSAVTSFFDNYYTPNFSVPMGWTGSIAGCVAGTTNQSYIDATFELINYYRAMAGLLGDVVNDTALNPGSQEAALMMIAEGDLSHNPPPSWACYTEAGADAAAASNLALGAAGPAAVRLYIRESGSFNEDVGHRRWILYPPRGAMGTGSNDGVNGSFVGANALYVFGTLVPRPATPARVAWPPAGYVPYQVVYDRWSFSLNSDPAADYSGASVTMDAGGAGVPLSVVSRTANFGDNTIVWEPSGLSLGPGMEDLPVTVTVTGIGNSSTTSATYEVKIFDPAVTSDEIFADGFESGDTSRWASTEP